MSVGRGLQTASNASTAADDEDTATLYFSTCADGHEGPLCAVCKPGWAEKSRGAVCVKCEEGESAIRGLGIFGLTAAVILFLLHSLRSALNESLRTVKVHLETAVLRMRKRERKHKRRSMALEALHSLVAGDTQPGTGPSNETSTGAAAAADAEKNGVLGDDELPSATYMDSADGKLGDASTSKGRSAGEIKTRETSSSSDMPADTAVLLGRKSNKQAADTPSAPTHQHLHAVLDAHQNEQEPEEHADPDSDANPSRFSRVALIRIIMTYLQTNALLGGLSLKGPELYEQIIGAASTPATGAPDQLTFVNCSFEWGFIVKLVAYALLPVLALLLVFVLSAGFLAALWQFDPEEKGYKGDITEDLAAAGDLSRDYDEGCKAVLGAAIRVGLVNENAGEEAGADASAPKDGQQGSGNGAKSMSSSGQQDDAAVAAVPATSQTEMT